MDEQSNSLPIYMRNERIHIEKIMQVPGENFQAMLARWRLFSLTSYWLQGWPMSDIRKSRPLSSFPNPSCSFWNFESFGVFCWPGHAAPRILVLRPWSKPMPPQMSPNHWTTRVQGRPDSESCSLSSGLPQGCNSFLHSRSSTCPRKKLDTLEFVVELRFIQ